MERTYTKKISILLADMSSISNPKHRILKHIKQKQLSGFHQWADNRACEGAFLIQNNLGYVFWILLIDWREQDNFYVVIFPESKSGPIAELHRLVYQNNVAMLDWRYSPIKRDGKNPERKERFSELYGSIKVRISIPKNLNEVDSFIDALFSLAIIRLKADNLDSA